MIKLDLKDKKLLYYLSLNARESDTQLSKKIGLSKNAVKYRIERLRKEGVIKHFASTINIGSIKATTFTILLKFNEDIYEDESILQFFEMHPYTDWLITLSGQWDIFVEMVCKDLYHMEDTIKEIVENFSKTLNTYQVFLSSDTLRVEHLIADFYKDLEVEELPKKPRTEERYEIDSTDRKILHLLNQDSSLPYLKIAEKLSLTMDIVRYRMKQLTEKNIIIKFFPEIDLKKLGYTEYLYTIRLKNVSKEKMQSIKKSISNNENVTYAFFDIISFNLIFVCAFKSAEDIDHLSKSLRKNYSDIMEWQDYLIIKDQILFNLFPKGLLEE